MNDIKLSFCMPTYNRSKFIGITLESIISQATDAIEIVILDGGSTDGTEDVVSIYKKQFKNIKYYKQDYKGGVDRDLNTAIENATGEYCWLMPDDDLLKPNAIKTVLQEIKHNYSLIIVNGEMRDTTLTKVLEQKRLPININKIYTPDQQSSLLVDTISHLTYTGAFVFKHSCWEQREKKKYYGSLFIEIGVVFQKKFNNNCLVIAEPLVMIRYGQGEWVPKSFEIWMFKLPELIWGFTNFTDTVKEQVCLKEPWKKSNELIKLRAKGAYSLKEYKKWLRPRIPSKACRFKSRLIAQFPDFIINIFAILYIYAFRPNAKGLLLDLKTSKCYWKNIIKNNF